ncbi:hypothetical protein ABFV50_32990, partial [Bacillus cereus]
VLSDDRARATPDQSIRTDATRTQARTNSLASDVREYQRTQPDTKTELGQIFGTTNRNGENEERSFEQFNRTSQQLDQAITTARNATQE